MDSLSKRLTAYQAANGAFVSWIVQRDGEIEDYNGFATALVLRALRQRGDVSAREPLCQVALDFLESCESPDRAGAFGFWPVQQRPIWAQRVPCDIDDTAVINLELAQYGRRTLDEVQAVVYGLLMAHLVQNERRPGPPWLRPLVFPTWIGKGGETANTAANPVDCCVNTNVVALMAYTGLTHLPGYSEACGMIADGIAWAGDSPLRIRSLTPYYPQPTEFLYALDHAITCGAVELQAPRDQLANDCAAAGVEGSQPGAICSNAYADPIWRCPALSLVRAYRQ
ncbi:MAG: hypothetical protein IT328_14065 [Caldilineaceae bacterium]|nr:hypothetical protein [Caldilineaceae bacterium]